MMTTIDVEEKVATIREALDSLRAENVLDGMLILELDQLLDRLRDEMATTTSDVGEESLGQ